MSGGLGNGRVRGGGAESRPVGWFQLYLFIFTQ